MANPDNVKQIAVAETEETQAQKKKSLSLSLIVNIIQTGLFVAFTAYGFTKNFKDSVYMPYIVALMVLYVASFAIVIALNVKDAGKVKTATKTYKTATGDVKLAIKVVKTIMLLFNVATSVLMVITTYAGEALTLTKVFALCSAGFSLLSALWTAFKVGRKVKKRVKKAKKQNK